MPYWHARRKRVKLPPIPTTRTGFTIPYQFKHLDDGSFFLQYDSGEDDESRIHMFATDQGLDDLKQYKKWSIDGTFKACLSNFYQLFTILINVDNHSFPRVFALLPNKAEECYKTLIFNSQRTDCRRATDSY